MFDKMSKLNSLGVVVAIKSNNSYSVKINDVIKHISGDMMSHTDLSDNVSETIDDNVSDNDSVHSDSSSDISDSDSISLFSQDVTPHVPQAPQQHVQRQRQPVVPMSPRRTRSGRRF